MAAIDPITLEVVTEGLISVVREMRATVFRTARSVAIYDAKDFSCGLFDHQSQVVAQSEDIGSHVVPLPWSVRASLDAFAGDLAPGDVILMNDPYLGGTHLNDVTLIYPVFEGDRLVFFPAVREHWADVGGMVPGSMSGTAVDIYQEGIRIPPIKIVEGGRINKPAMDLMMANMRVPSERLGDFHSGLSACRTAERRIAELIRRYGIELLLECVARNLDRSEARMRAQIGRLPDGEAYYEDYLETFSERGLEPLLLPLRLTVQGEEMIADFTGVSPQVPVPVNSTLAVTAASVFITLKSVLDPKAALNHGSFRPVKVIAPKGTIVNVTHPAPAGSHGEIRKRVIAATLGCLAQMAPELVSADIHRTSFHNLIGGIHPKTGREYVHYEWSCGGNGAFLEADGPSTMAAIDWGDLNTAQASEILETRYPLFIEWSKMGTDSGGDGFRRGGLGLRRAIRLTAEHAQYSLLSDGAVVPPFGVLGGEAAAPVDSYIMRDGKKLAFATPGKVGGFAMQRDDVLILQSAGGGGYGEPLERPLAEVAEDVREGYVSSVQARAHYGAVIAEDGTADEPASLRLRRQQLADRVWLKAQSVDGDLYAAGKVSRRRVAPLNPADMTRLGVGAGALVDLIGPGAAPLRAWIVADDKVEPGTMPVDAMARRVLRVADGAPVRVRPIRLPEIS
ncbi:MAG: hydantoinase B/oxoprolinase family protein [Alphaproteobacteria bacterium]|nr:hydantoinase B/oxoprolinase family protein [Alphaproteobacteria bacterium]